jgi:hypothetical protein
MSDPKSMPPKEWLAHVRQKLGATRQFAFPKTWLEDFLRYVPAESRERARATWMNRRNMTVSEVEDEMILQYLDHIAPALTPEEGEVIRNTLIAVYPTFEFDAYAGQTPRGDRAILLHEAVGHTLAYWSYWYTRIVIDSDGRDYSSTDRKKISRVVTYMLSVWYGVPWVGDIPEIYPKTLDGWKLSESMTMAALAFVIGHELGHVLHHHSGYSSDVSANHAMEFQADDIGFVIAIRYALLRSAVSGADSYYTKFMLFGPLLVLAVLSLLFGDEASDTHPSPSDRRRRLITSYERAFRQLFGQDRAQWVINEIDPELVSILDKNSKALFARFAQFEFQELVRNFGKPDNGLLVAEFQAVDRLLPGRALLRDRPRK